MNYSYFCGANVKISFNGLMDHDVAGISYEVIDSTAPVYGYSSRVFDAVAPGQKLVRGSFVVNFKSYRFLTAQLMATKFKVSRSQAYQAFDNAIDLTGITGYDMAYQEHAAHIEANFCKEVSGKKVLDSSKASDFVQYVSRIMYSDTYSNQYDATSLGMSLYEDFGLTEENLIVSPPTKSLSSLDMAMMGPFNIQLDFGSDSNSFTIVSCYVNNFRSTVQISEDVILQEFSFFGRNIIS